jgi:hypothetical protein
LQVVKKETAKDHDGSQSDARSGGEWDDVLARWTQAAEQPSAGPIMHTWDTAKDSCIRTGVTNGKQEYEEHIKDGPFVSEGGVAVFNQAYVRYASKALNQAPTVVKVSGRHLTDSGLDFESGQTRVSESAPLKVGQTTTEWKESVKLLHHLRET